MVPETVERNRIIYKDEKRDSFHVYTSQEMGQKREIDLIRKKAISLYELALELLGRAQTAHKNGNFDEARRWHVQAYECNLRGMTIEEKAVKKHLELLENIGRVEGWEVPE